MPRALVPASGVGKCSWVASRRGNWNILPQNQLCWREDAKCPIPRFHVAQVTTQEFSRGGIDPDANSERSSVMWGRRNVATGGVTTRRLRLPVAPCLPVDVTMAFSCRQAYSPIFVPDSRGYSSVRPAPVGGNGDRSSLLTSVRLRRELLRLAIVPGGPSLRRDNR